MPPPLILEPEEINLDTILADQTAIAGLNPQRFEMVQIDAICLMDPHRQLIVGYKDVHANEFWVKGHFPGNPLMPGVLMCEAAAQLSSYYLAANKIITEGIIGFGGMEEVRFRNPVKPGNRLVLVGKAIKIRKLQSSFNVQGLVNGVLAFHGTYIAVPLAKEGD